MRSILKRTVHYSFVGAKKVLNKSPGLKDKLKRVVETQMGLSVSAELSSKKWLEQNFPDYMKIATLRKEASAFTYQPLISIVVPTYNTDRKFLCECFDSVLGQVYENWELCIVDDASPDATVREIIKEYSNYDSRIKYQFLKTNRHISGASNEAIKLAKGEFVGLLDHDDIVWPNALHEVAKALNDDKKLDFLYSDEDKITDDRHKHGAVFFKPDWNPDFLHSVNYITHFTVIRKSLLTKAGGFQEKYNGAQDWDLFLRMTSMTEKIHHIPKVLYSWRVHDESTAKHTKAKPYVVEAQHGAILADLERKGYPDAIVEQDKKHPGYWNTTIPVSGNPLISIIIPTKNQYKIIKRCINSIYKKSTYKNFEIILVDTGSTDRQVKFLYRRLRKRNSNLKIIYWSEQPFSYSRTCNKGAAAAKGELLLFLNNDTEVLTSNWLELLAGDAQREEIGAVGCLLFYSDGIHIQHAGVGVGLGGVAANSFSMMTLDQKMSQTQHLMINTKHNMTAVTAACMMIKKVLFEKLGGFDEKLRVSYNDVDLCLRLYEKGYQNLYTPYVRLIHHESISVGMPEEIEKRDTKEFKAAQLLFKKRWHKYINHDPNLNPSLSKDNAFYVIPQVIKEKTAEE